MCMYIIIIHSRSLDLTLTFPFFFKCAQCVSFPLGPSPPLNFDLLLPPFHLLAGCAVVGKTGEIDGYNVCLVVCARVWVYSRPPSPARAPIRSVDQRPPTLFELSLIGVHATGANVSLSAAAKCVAQPFGCLE